MIIQKKEGEQNIFISTYIDLDLIKNNLTLLVENYYGSVSR